MTEEFRKNEFKTDKTILERFNNCGFMEKIAINTLMKNYSVDNTDISVAAEKMETYLNS